jgi:predicted PurR-regulated permease PerM
MNMKKFAQDLIFYAAILVGIGGLIYIYRVLIGPLVIAALLAYLLYPGVTWIKKRTQLDRKYIVPLVFIVFVGIIVLIFIYISPIVIQQARMITSGLQTIPEQIGRVESDIERIFGFDLPLESFWITLQNDATQLLQPERVFRVIQTTSTNSIWVFVIFVTTFYLLRDWERLRDWLLGIAPADYQTDVQHLYLEIKTIWRAYLRGQLLILFLVGLLSGLGAGAIGLPGPVVLGILAGTLALIPTLGPTIATVIAAVVAWTQGSAYLDISNVALTIVVVAIFQAVQLFDGIWLTPQIMGKRLALHPGIVLVAVIRSLVTAGATLALIIAPLIGSLEIIIRYIRRKRAGLDPWPFGEISHSFDVVVVLVHE